MPTVFVLLLLVSLLGLSVGLISPTRLNKILKRDFSRGRIVLIFGMLFIVSLIGIGATAEAPSETSDSGQVSVDQAASEPRIATSESAEEKVQQAENATEGETNTSSDTQVTKSVIEQIEEVVMAVDDFEVTVWTEDGNFAEDDSLGPFEIIVNSSDDDIDDCFDAKSDLHYVMKGLYTNENINFSIARVRFSAWGELKASVGSNDGLKLEWDSFGPSLLWSVLLQTRPYEYEYGTLSERTWGEKIDQECN